jgi:hypothetical protein
MKKNISIFLFIILTIWMLIQLILYHYNYQKAKFSISFYENKIMTEQKTNKQEKLKELKNNLLASQLRRDRYVLYLIFQTSNFVLMLFIFLLLFNRNNSN